MVTLFNVHSLCRYPKSINFLHINSSLTKFLFLEERMPIDAKCCFQESKDEEDKLKPSQDTKSTHVAVVSKKSHSEDYDGYVDEDDRPLTAKLLRNSIAGTSISNNDYFVQKKPFSKVREEKQDGFGISSKQARPSTMAVKIRIKKRPGVEVDYLNSLAKKPKVSYSDASIETELVSRNNPQVIDNFNDGVVLPKKLERQTKSAKRSCSNNSGNGSEHSILSAALDLKGKKPALIQHSIKECQMTKRRESEAVQRSIDEFNKELEAKAEQLKLIQKLISKCNGHLRLKEEQYIRELEMVQKVISERDKVHKKMQREMKECDKDIELKEIKLNLMEELIREHKQKLKLEQIEFCQVMDNMDKDRERKEEELKALANKIDVCTKEVKTKEEELSVVQKLIDGESEKVQLERKKFLLVMSLRIKEEAQVRKIESMKKKLEEQVKEFESKENEVAGRMGELELKKKQCDGLLKKLKSDEEKLECRVRELESKGKKFEGQVEELESNKRHFEEKLKELQSKEKQFEDQVLELKSKMNEFEVHAKELESKEKVFEGKVKDLESKENSFEGRVNELEKRERQYDEQVKKLKLEEQQLECQAKELESKEMKFEGQVEELQSNKKNFEGKLKEIQSKEQKFEDQVKKLKSKVNELEVQAKELKSKEKQIEGEVKVLRFKEKQLEVQLMELSSRQKQFEGEAKGLEPKKNQFQGNLKKQYEALIKLFKDEKVQDNQSSFNNDGRSNLQMFSDDQTNEPMLLDDDILICLQSSSDPAKLILDIIKDPIVPQCKKGDKVVSLDDSHIFLLDQLMRISPYIKPHVKEEALKLALDLKANMRLSGEDSLVVLGFLLILSIYGLVSSFDEHEVLGLFEITARHKQAVDLFQMLGFEDKIADFVENLIKKQQNIEAVKFICAYKLGEKNQPIDLLREHVKNAKLNCESSCKKTKSIRIKVEARDEEIASLGSVLQCISDNSIECEGLVKEIQYRILELKMLIAKECQNLPPSATKTC